LAAFFQQASQKTYFLPDTRRYLAEIWGFYVKNEGFSGRLSALRMLRVGFAFTFQILLPQNVTNAVDIAGDDGQCNVAFETIDAMIRAFVQAMNFQCVDS